MLTPQSKPKGGYRGNRAQAQRGTEPHSSSLYKLLYPPPGHAHTTFHPLMDEECERPPRGRSTYSGTRKQRHLRPDMFTHLFIPLMGRIAQALIGEARPATRTHSHLVRVHAAARLVTRTYSHLVRVHAAKRAPPDSDTRKRHRSSGPSHGHIHTKCESMRRTNSTPSAERYRAPLTRASCTTNRTRSHNNSTTPVRSTSASPAGTTLRG
jgi:hypothetical protein